MSSINCMQPQQDFKVGDIIIYNGNKTYAYILQVADDFIKIYDETNILTRINQREVDKKVDFKLMMLLNALHSKASLKIRKV